jgi:glutaminase
MPIRLTGEQVRERLEDLYRRHLPLDEGGVASYYDAERGYYEPEAAGEEQDRFAICVARTDGEVLSVGDALEPFALQSISKVFVYGLALADWGRERVVAHVGVEPSGDARSTRSSSTNATIDLTTRWSTPGRS